jgi:hypothetical protein
MDFIRALTNDEELILDEDLEKFLEEIIQLEDMDLLDENVWARIEKRVAARDLLMYKYIVGAAKLMGTKKFLELAKQGKSVPGTFVKAYQPVLEMVDDIITAGPTYVQLLRVLHKRAQRERK